MHKKALLIGLTSLFCVLSTMAVTPAYATGRITGTVIDKQSGEALPGANVVIEGTSIGAASDLEGRFTIAGVRAGAVTLVASYVGYEKTTVQVTVVDNRTTTVNIEMDWEGVEGEEVVITAQAEGQVQAINQQLASNTITNIVSADRIQELPDVNAAESVGRLPGIAIQRSGGEANKISIRGLSPKYATVTVNGVRVPSTGNDRDVDLSLISSNMLSGIEVKKAITADMDADAHAGSVDLRLRKAPVGLEVDVLGQGGYNHLQSYYGNYKFTGTLSNRFFKNRLGAIATVNSDEYDRSADKFNGSYRQQSNAQTNESEIVLSSLNLREETVTRGRIGASLLLDYNIPRGTITANTFYNKLHGDGVYRVNRMSIQDNRHYYDVNQSENTTSILTAALAIEQNFDWIRYDAGVSQTASRGKSPRNYAWAFVEEGNAFDFQDYIVSPETYPTDILAYTTQDSSETGIADVYYDNYRNNEDQTALQLNVSVPFRLGNYINGYVKTGGKLRWLERTNDQEREGRNGLQYGTTGGRINQYLRCADEQIPEGFNGFDIGETTAAANWLPIFVFDEGYRRNDFLGGDYPLGYSAGTATARRFSQAIDECGYFREYPNESRGNDYTGEERYQAGYVMTEINLGKYITFIPGIRWEGDWSRYTGQRYREVTLNNEQAEPTDLDTLINERDYTFLLPMVHLQIAPLDWLKLRLARTETLQRPGFNQYAPISRIDSQQQFAFAGNADLKPSTSTNYDASLSIYENKVGLFTVSGFHKTVADHIIWVRYYSTPDRPVLPGLNIPQEWIVNPNTGQPNNPKIDTYINNNNDATYKGIEFDWQTNFWYLPSFLKGIVLNVNYTRIFSDTEYDGFFTKRICTNCVPGEPPPRRPSYSTVTLDTLRAGRMVDQPAHVANVTLGYDLKGFSARLSYLYQADRVNSVDAQVPILDTFSGAYSRFDLTLRQKLGGRFNGLEFFTNFNNLNNREDRSFQGSPTSGSPTYIEYYGFSMDLGARYRF